MQKAGAQQDARAQRSVQLCAAGKVASTQYVTFVLYQNFPLLLNFSLT